MSLEKAERDHLVSELVLPRFCRQIVITPRLASIQILLLNVVFVQAGINTKAGLAVLRGS
jgi:hypothetical protein